MVQCLTLNDLKAEMQISEGEECLLSTSTVKPFSLAEGLKKNKNKKIKFNICNLGTSSSCRIESCTNAHKWTNFGIQGKP